MVATAGETRKGKYRRLYLYAIEGKQRDTRSNVGGVSIRAGVGTVLRLERGAWSMVKSLRQATPERPNIGGVSIRAGVGTVLRLERRAWSMVKSLRQATNEYALPPPPHL